MEVMIVDDEPVARRSVRECCEREPDLKVVGEFGDPSAALEAIRLQPPQLLFLDIQMDSMSGLALARALDPLSLPLIVFVTAYDQYALEAFEVSAVDYLLKPFDDARFKATLARVDRKSTRLNSSHGYISYAVFCLKKKKYTALHGTSQRTQPYVDLRLIAVVFASLQVASATPLLTYLDTITPARPVPTSITTVPLV